MSYIPDTPFTYCKKISTATTNATLIKNSAGVLGYLTASNSSSSPRFLKLYDKASAPTVGTDVPIHTFLIPGNASGAGSNIPLGAGMAFSTGLALAITAGAVDSDATAVGLTDVIVNYGYL
jgi:hypothetical protein